jgi:hypothetical protein
MNFKTIESLLNIASMANRWPRLAHIRDAALKELEMSHLSTVETITPVYVTNGKNEESANDDPQSR